MITVLLQFGMFHVRAKVPPVLLCCCDHSARGQWVKLQEDTVADSRDQDCSSQTAEERKNRQTSIQSISGFMLGDKKKKNKQKTLSHSVCLELLQTEILTV